MIYKLYEWHLLRNLDSIPQVICFMISDDEMKDDPAHIRRIISWCLEISEKVQKNSSKNTGISEIIIHISSLDQPAMDTAFWNIRQFRFTHENNRVRIRFSAIGNNPASYYNYQYRVMGLDKAWKDLGHSTEINLALPPGEYMVEITGNHSFNPQLGPQQSIRLVIVPPFYKQWWFMSLAALALLVLEWYIYNHRVYI